MTIDLAKIEKDFASTMRERIRAAVLDAIPQEKWDDLTKTALQEFFEERRSYHTAAPTPSEFQLLIRKVAEEIIREKVKAILTTDFMPTYNSELQEYVNENLRKVLVSAAPAIVESMFRQAAQHIVSSMTGRM